MEKYSLYPGVREDGYPLIHLIEPGTSYGLKETAGLEKTASGEHLPEVIELIEALAPQPNRLYLVNSALGAGEFLGFNLRGDWFTEKGLLHTPPGWDDIPVWDIDARRQAANYTESVPGWGDLAWGFPTFYNSHRYRHHANQNPDRAYGFILGAFWDPRMHRVILVSELIKELCSKLGALDLYDRIGAGEFVDTSMGTKVPFDICSICGHVSKNPSSYCEHVHKNASSPYGMRAVLPDGRMCGVYNDYPRFFDDSFVFIGAEKTAKVMSNMTERVKGNRAYTQKVYPFVPPLKKEAADPMSNTKGDEITSSSGTGPSVLTPAAKAQEQAKKMEGVVKDIFAPPPPDDSLEEKMTRLISGRALSNPKDREVLRYLQQMKKAEGKLKAGKLSQKEFGLLDGLEKRKLKGQGIKDSDIERVKKESSEEMQRLVQASGKTGSAKWAEMWKQLPAPSPSQISTIRDHEARLPDIPKGTLDRLSESPGDMFRAAAKLGIVLKPHEFQYGLLKGQYPQEAEEYRSQGKVFQPTPLDFDMTPHYDAHAPVPDEVSRIVSSLLGPSLCARSFAPSAVRIRIVTITPIERGPEYESMRAPLLDKVSSLYNEYRAGLIAHPLDWRDVKIPQQVFTDLGQEEKLASSASEMSQYLLSLAYWPSITVG